MSERVRLETSARSIQEFKELQGVNRILGVIGGSDKAVVSSCQEQLVGICSQLCIYHGRFGVLSGGTTGGVPEMALTVAKQLQLPTIGVYPQSAEKYAAHSKIDHEIPVPLSPLSDVKWGMETPILASIPDAFILIGGEWGTLTEVSTIMKRNVSRAEKGLPLTPIIPLLGSGKLADNLSTILTGYLPVPEGSILYPREDNQITDVTSLLIHLWR